MDFYYNVGDVRVILCNNLIIDYRSVSPIKRLVLIGDFGMVSLHAGGVLASGAAVGDVRQRVEQQELHDGFGERRASL